MGADMEDATDDTEDGAGMWCWGAAMTNFFVSVSVLLCSEGEGDKRGLKEQ